MKFQTHSILFAVVVVMMCVRSSRGAQKALYHIEEVRNSSHHSDVDDRIYLDNGKVLKRDKRFLIYSGAGIAKVR